jgi:hypothetical protein
MRALLIRILFAAGLIKANRSPAMLLSESTGIKIPHFGSHWRIKKLFARKQFGRSDA